MTKLPTCRKMTDVLSDDLDGLLSPEQLELFERHLALCPTCAAYVESLRGTKRLAMEALKSDEVPPEVTAMVGALLEQFRKG